MKIELSKGDLTRESTDAIVNAANSSLLGGGGVDGAIHKAGGPQILEECKKIRARQGGCPTGEAVYTMGGNLTAKYVIHTVGPVWKGGNNREEIQLRNCYENSLRLAEKLELNSIAFPNISTGIYGFPKNSAAEIALNTVRKFHYEHLETVKFVCFDDENYQIYLALLK